MFYLIVWSFKKNIFLIVNIFCINKHIPVINIINIHKYYTYYINDIYFLNKYKNINVSKFYL